MKNLKMIVTVVLAVLTSNSYAEITRDQAKQFALYLHRQLEVGTTYRQADTGIIQKNGQYLCDLEMNSDHKLVSMTNDSFTYEVIETSNFNEDCKLETVYQETRTETIDGFVQLMMDLQDELKTEQGVTMSLDFDKKLMTYSAIVDGKKQGFPIDFSQVRSPLEYDAMLTEGSNSDYDTLGAGVPGNVNMSFEAGKPVYSEF